jgi:glutamine amidotransferase
MKNRICIIKIGSSGNLLNIERAIQNAGGNFIYFSENISLDDFDKIILPGVGNFKDAMNTIEPNRKKITEIIMQKPTLGICLGMQVLSNVGFEDGESKGLGLIEGEVVKLKVTTKIPHLGWNTLIHRKNNPLLKNIDNSEKFYFMHSYEFVNFTDFITLTDYNGHLFVSSVNKNKLFGVQFHPEKSGESGIKLLRNFIELD